MLGSSISVSGPNIILNTAVAEALKQFYEELKNAPKDKINEAVHALVKETILKHKRIIFNGNGYSDEWVEEATKRGLYNLKSTPEALPCFTAKKNIDLFVSHSIFTESEIFSRHEILLENYCKTIHIEAKTLQEMVRRQFLPTVLEYQDVLTQSIQGKRTVADLPCTAECKLLKTLAESYEKLSAKSEELLSEISTVEAIDDMEKASFYYYETIIPKMEEIRVIADQTEELLPDDMLPYPSYEELLFSI